MRSIACAACGVLGLLALAGCEPQGAGAPAGGSAATAGSAPAAGAASETADEFVARVNRELTVLAQEAQAAGFTQDTYITPDTELLNARATERYLAYLSRAVAEAQRYDGQPLEPATARALMKLRLNVAAPAPDDPEKRARMTQLEARMQSMYGEGKYCPRGPKSCETIDQLQEIMATSRDYAQLLDAWKGWHGIGAGMRDDYTEFVALANEGARQLGFADLGVMWRSGYDMPPQAFEDLSGRLWQQVKPLYVESAVLRARAARPALWRRQGAARQADPGAAARQHVGAAVDEDLSGHPPALPASRRRNRGCAAEERAVGRGATDALGGELLHLAGIRTAARWLLGALHADAAARPRSGVPRQRLGHGVPRRRARQGVPRAHRGGPLHHLPRARTRLSTT